MKRSVWFLIVPIVVALALVLAWLSTVGLNAEIFQFLVGCLIIVALGVVAYFAKARWLRILAVVLSALACVGSMGLLVLAVGIERSFYKDNELVSPDGKLVGVTRHVASDFVLIEVSTRSGWPIRRQVVGCWRYNDGPDRWVWQGPSLIKASRQEGPDESLPVTVTKGLIPTSVACPKL